VLATELVNAAETIVGDPPNFCRIDRVARGRAGRARRIASAIDKVVSPVAC
jgi:hypothetical protein